MSAIEYYTYDDLIKGKGDWELIDGIPLAMAPAPMITHQALANMIVHQLTSASEECEECTVASEGDWKISDDTVLRSDVVLVCDVSVDFERVFRKFRK